MTRFYLNAEVCTKESGGELELELGGQTTQILSATGTLGPGGQNH